MPTSSLVLGDKQFMQCFWDFASDESATRLTATEAMMKTLKEVNDNQSLEEYKVYTLNRLTKGLTSPRDSARLGFSVALTIFLTTYPSPVDHFLTLIDSHTQISGSMKGSEERDCWFGKLFAYMSLLRAGLLSNAESSVVSNIIERIISLYNKKQWMQELASEALLVVLSSCSSSVSVVILPQLLSLCSGAVSELNENQLALRIGLQIYCSRNKSLQKEWKSLKLDEQVISMDLLEIMTPSLLHSAHKFPKIHRVWDYIIALIFDLGEDGEVVPVKNLLSEQQLTGLKRLVLLLNDEMLTSSKEKRALAMKISIKLLRIVPAHAYPLVFSERLIKSITLARVNRKALLYDYCGALLQDISDLASSREDCLMAILTNLVQFGGNNFDKATSSKTIAHCMEKLSPEGAIEFLKTLCTLFGNSELSEEEGPLDMEVEANEEDINAASYLNSSLALRALTYMAELAHVIASKSDLHSAAYSSIYLIFLRVSCFSTGRTLSFSSTKQTDQKKKKSKDSAATNEPKSTIQSSQDSLYLECIHLVELNLSSSTAPTSLQEHASELLLGLFHGLIHPKSVAPDVKSSSPVTSVSSSAVSDSYAVLWKYLDHMIKCGLVFYHERDEFDPKIFKTVYKNIHRMIEIVGGNTKESSHRVENFCYAAMGVVSVATMQALVSDELDIEIITTLADALSEIIISVLEGKKSCEDDDDDDETDSAQLVLFDQCVELLSISSDKAIKTLRDAVKKVWSCLFALYTDDESQISQTFVDALVTLLVETDAPEDGAEEDEDDGGDDEDMIEMDERHSHSHGAAKTNSKKSKKSSDSKEEEAEKDNEDDILVAKDDFMDFMMTNDDEFQKHVIDDYENDDDDDDGDRNSQGSDNGEKEDSALAQIVKLRQESRKKGLLNIKKKQLLMRSRVLDILEALVSRLRSGPLLFSLLQPLFAGLKKSITSKILQDLPEAKAFTQRLQNIVVGQVCKKKIVLKLGEDEELVGECIEETKLLSQTARSLCWSKLPILRALGQELLLCLIRSIVSSDCIPAKTVVIDFVSDIWKHYSTQRRCPVPYKSLEDIIVGRFPHVFLPALWTSIISGLETATTSYCKSEILELIAAAMKKVSQLDAATKALVFKGFPSLISSLQASLVAIPSNTDREEKKAKRQKKSNNKDVSEVDNDLNSSVINSSNTVKAALACVKALLETVKKESIPANSLAFSALQVSLESLIKSSPQQSQSIAQLSQEAINLIAKVQSVNAKATKTGSKSVDSGKTDVLIASATTNEEDKSKNKSKKRKA